MYSTVGPEEAPARCLIHHCVTWGGTKVSTAAASSRRREREREKKQNGAQLKVLGNLGRPALLNSWVQQVLMQTWISECTFHLLDCYFFKWQKDKMNLALLPSEGKIELFHVLQISLKYVSHLALQISMSIPSMEITLSKGNVVQPFPTICHCCLFTFEKEITRRLN